MRITYCHCDVCNSVIKPGDTKYALLVHTLREDNRQSYEELVEKLTDKQHKYYDIQIFEICDECKKILAYLFKMKKEEREKALKSIETLMEEDGGKKNGKIR